MTSPESLLKNARSIAVVGCSATPGKDAHEVPAHLVRRGYEVFPVNPTAKEIFGRKAYATLAEVPRPVDIVNVFRPAAEAPAIVQQAIDAGARAVWLQSGIASPEARALADAAGLPYVEDACIRVVDRMIAR